MLSPNPLENAISTRDLTFTRSDGVVEQVVVAIGAPIQVEEGYWHCPYIIKSESFAKQFRMAGADSMQALIHAVHIINVELDALARSHGGVFRYFDHDDLMFPSEHKLAGEPGGRGA